VKEQGAIHQDPSRPADVLVHNWTLGKAAAFDLTIVSPLISAYLYAAGDKDPVRDKAELKHAENDAKCAALGWVCVPLAVDSYGRWCEEAHGAFAKLAEGIKMRTGVSLSIALSSVYNLLGVTLARCNARSILARPPCADGGPEVIQYGHQAVEPL